MQGSKTGTRLAPVVLIVSSVWRKFAQRRRTARRSTAVAVDLPVFSSSFSYVLLNGVDRLFGHAPSKMSHPATSEWKSCFSPLALLSSVDGSFSSSPLFVSFLHISLLKSQSSHPTNVVEIPRSS